MIPGPQKTQMLDLDRAIDQVAVALTRVDDDDQLAARIVAHLPERHGWFGWLMQSWAPRFALLALIVGSGLFINRGAKTVAPIQASPIAAPALFVAAVNPEPIRTKPLERLERLEPVEPLGARPDHERSLPPLDSVAALSVDSVSPASLPDEAPLMVAPLTIEPLALEPVQR